MIPSSFELNTTHYSTVAVQQLENAFSQETEGQEKTITREIEVQPNPLALSKTYIRILEVGGHLGC